MAVVEPTEVTAHAGARDAVARGDWAEGFRLLTQLDRERGLGQDELDLLGQAAYGAGDLEAAIGAWERLHAVAVAAGDHLAGAAAAATVAVYLMMDTGLMAPVRSWIARAERLLEGHDEHPAHALLAMVRAYERLLCGDAERARPWAARAVETGVRQGVPVAAALGRVATARLAILDGEVDTGLRLLDDAAVSLVSSDLDPLGTGMVYCELICAMQGLGEHERAAEWTAAMDRWRQDGAPGGINGRCRVHRAEILRLRGSCEEAEDEALHACDELRPWMRREYGWPLTELGTIRLRRGDLAGAREAFLAAHERGWDPHPGLALLHLAEGEADTALALISDALSRPFDTPWKERPPRAELSRAPLLDAQVEIALAAGDPDVARRAADELTAIAALFRSRGLTAVAALARARVALAGADPAAAIADGDTAVREWCEVGAPFEVAVARTVVAAALRAQGDEDRAALELAAAHRAFERIGARRRADELASPPEPSAPSAPTVHAPSPATGRCVFRLDGDTRTIVFAGEEVLLRDLKGFRYLERLLAEPGREFHVLDLVGVDTGAPRGGAPAAAAATEDGLELVTDGGLGPALDDQAREAYRRRLADIDDDIEEARRHGDLERVALAEADRDYLVRELANAFGLGGRARPVGASSERARASVGRAIRYALARVAEHHPALADHLDRTVSTGVYCAYAPDPRVPTVWER